jgi:hypothetical protein
MNQIQLVTNLAQENERRLLTLLRRTEARFGKGPASRHDFRGMVEVVRDAGSFWPNAAAFRHQSIPIRWSPPSAWNVEIQGATRVS